MAKAKQVDKQVKVAAFMLSGLMMTSADNLADFRKKRLGRSSAVDLDHLQSLRDVLLALADVVKSNGDDDWERVAATHKLMFDDQGRLPPSHGDAASVEEKPEAAAAAEPAADEPAVATVHADGPAPPARLDAPPEADGSTAAPAAVPPSVAAPASAPDVPAAAPEVAAASVPPPMSAPAARPDEPARIGDVASVPLVPAHAQSSSGPSPWARTSAGAGTSPAAAAAPPVAVPAAVTPAAVAPAAVAPAAVAPPPVAPAAVVPAVVAASPPPIQPAPPARPEPMAQSGGTAAVLPRVPDVMPSISDGDPDSRYSTTSGVFEPGPALPFSQQGAASREHTPSPSVDPFVLPFRPRDSDAADEAAAPPSPTASGNGGYPADEKPAAEPSPAALVTAPSATANNGPSMPRAKPPPPPRRSRPSNGDSVSQSAGHSASQNGPAATSLTEAYVLLGERTMKLTEYAAMCACCGAFPQRIRETHSRYGISDFAARQQLDGLWQQRFATDAALRELWQTLFGRFRAWLVEHGADA